MPAADAPGLPQEATNSAPAPPQSWVWLARIRRPQGRKGEVFADLLTDFPEKFAQRKQLWLLAKPPAATHNPDSNSQVLNSESSRRAASIFSQRLQVSGQGFSRAGNAPVSARASAPAGRPPAINAPREVQLIAHWLHKGGIVLHFAGIDSISAAETLSGLTVAIPQSQRASLDADEVYIADLIGCTLVDVAGAEPMAVGEIEEVDRSAGPVALLVVNGALGQVLVPFAKSYLRAIDLNAKRVEMALPEGLVDLNLPGK